MVHPKRHIAKAITWKILASIVTFFIAMVIVKNITISLKLLVVDFIIKAGLYYIHERFWYKKIRFGIDEEK